MASNTTTGLFSTLHTFQYNISNFSANYTNYTTPNPNATVRPRLPRSNAPDIRVVILIYAINGLFVLVGVFGNIFVCYVISKGRRMYTVANLFLMNLAVADTCILTISYPLWILMSGLVKWPLGGIMCKILPSISDSFYGVSLGSITTISIYRYRMILYPLNTHMTFFQAKVTILVIWIVSLLTISAPLYPVIVFDPRRKRCGSQWGKNLIYLQVYQWVMLIMWYIIPLAIILYTYIRIRNHLKHEMKYKWLKNHSNGNTKGVNGQESPKQAISGHVMGIKRALKLLAPVVVVFTLFMFPWNLGRLLSVVTNVGKLKRIDILHYLGATLLFANSAVNAFIYYFMSREFREEFKQRFRVFRKFFRLGKAGHFAVQRNYSMSFKTRIELLSVARSGTRRCVEVAERLTVV